MPDRKRKSEEIREANLAINRPQRDRGKAAASKTRLSVPDAAAGVLIDTDPALDDRSETDLAAARAAKKRRAG